MLTEYWNIINGEKIAQFQQSKYIPVTFDSREEIEVLWKKHDDALNKLHLSDILPRQSLFDLKIELARRIFAHCSFCERRCYVDRNHVAGWCRVKQASIVSEFIHMGEEPVLVPSHTIFFSGCTFSCVFCQNDDISQHHCGYYVKPELLGETIQNRQIQGSRNVNWVGGDPTPNILYILQVLKKLKENVPQIWNSNMFCSHESMKILQAVIDVYLTDFKFGNNECAKRLADVDNYVEVVKRNHLLVYENGEMIIRHLVMPNHGDCCSKPIIDWIAANLPNVVVNVMGQYRPEYKAKQSKEIARAVSLSELEEIQQYTKVKNLNII